MGTVEALRKGHGWPWTVNRASKIVAAQEFGLTYGHPTAGEVRRAFPEEWANYVKFTVVRNPFDRMYSDYRWRVRHGEVSFLRYLRALRDSDDLGGLVSPAWDAWQYLAVGEELALDHYCRFENLPASLSDVLAVHSIPWTGGLARVNARAGSARYLDAYGEEERELVTMLCSRELTAFGYSFGDAE
jgi:hypothetical protein